MRLQRRGLLTVLFLMLLLAVLLTGCGGSENPKIKSEDPNPQIDDPGEEPGDPNPPDPPIHDPVEVPSAPVLEGNTATIMTGDSKLVLHATDNALVIDSLSVLNGTKALDAPSSFALPESAGKEQVMERLHWQYEISDCLEENEEDHKLYTVTFRYREAEQGLILRVSVVARPGIAGPFEFRTSIENENDVAVGVSPGCFASLSFMNDGEVVRIAKESGMAEGYKHYNGLSYAGTGIYRDVVTEEPSEQPVMVWVTTHESFNSSGYLPMIYFDRGTSGLYIALEWSSGRITTETKNGILTLGVDMDKLTYGGVDGDNFRTSLPAGEIFELPSVYVGAYDGDLDDGSNVFKHWFFDCKAPAKLRNDPNEPLSQMDVIGGDVFAGLNDYGIESMKWDYGWWAGSSGCPGPYEGSWTLSETRFLPSDFGSMADYGLYLKSLGINWTVYTLLHDTNCPGIWLPTNTRGEFNSITHPDWFSNRRIAREMGYSADLGNKECVEYLKETMTHFFADNYIGTWRSDFEPICFYSNKENRHAANGPDVMYWCTYGFRELVEHLYANVPDFRYESCSSGGSMKDLFTATLAVSINNDDCADYLSLRTTFYDSSYVIHPAQLQEPCNCDFFNPDVSFHPVVTTTAPADFDFKGTMLDMGFRSMMLGSPMFCSWSGNEPTEYFQKYAALYAEKIRPLTRDAELYHILPRPDGVNYDGVMYADPDSENEIKGVIFLFKPSETPGNQVHVPVKGLDPNLTYQLTFEDRPAQNFTAKGADLMSNGFDVTIEYVGSELIWITEAK